MSHTAPVGISKNKKYVFSPETSEGSLQPLAPPLPAGGLEQGLRGRASPQVPHRKKLSVAEISTAITTKSTNSLNN